MRRTWVIVAAVVIAFTVVAALVAQTRPEKPATRAARLTIDLASPAGSGTDAGHAKPARATAIPVALPPEGVIVAGDVLLEPVDAATLAAVKRGQGVTATQAAALPEGEQLPARAQLADVTVGRGPTQDRACWVVIYTYPQARNVSLGPSGSAPVMARHSVHCVDVRTGEFVLGFFTP